MAWQEYQLAHKLEVEGNMSQIKEEKAHTQAMPSPNKMQRMKT